MIGQKDDRAERRKRINDEITVIQFLFIYILTQKPIGQL